MSNVLEASERTALGEAIDDWHAAKAEVENLRQAEERATAMVDEAEATAMGLAEVAAEVATFRARRIVENLPAATLSTLPGRLDARLMDKKNADARVDEYRAALAVISDDIEAAEQRVIECAQAAHDAIIEVMRSEGDDLARELSEVEARAYALRRNLIALSCMWAKLPGMPKIGPMEISDYARQVLRSPPPLKDLKLPETELTEGWRAYYLALSANAEAVPSAADSRQRARGACV